LAGVKLLSRVVDTIAAKTSAAVTVTDTARVSDTDVVAARTAPAFLTLAVAVLAVASATAIALLSTARGNRASLVRAVRSRETSVADADIAGTRALSAAAILADTVRRRAAAVRSTPAGITLAFSTTAGTIARASLSSHGSAAFGSRAVARRIRRDLAESSITDTLTDLEIAATETAVRLARLVLAEGSKKSSRASAGSVAGAVASMLASLRAVLATTGRAIEASLADASIRAVTSNRALTVATL